MFTLPNFCRVCLKYDKNLIDLEHIENEPNETLMSKLQHCVAEVDWKDFKPLLCHPCIKRLNIAYTFKKQCAQSASMLKSYVALVTKSKEEGVAAGDPSNAYMMLPNQKYIKIVVPQNQNSFQNVFLNVVPSITGDNNNTNHGVVLNINNTKLVATTSSTDKNLNVNELLTDSKSEELSVEIDPTDFGLDNSDDDGESAVNDWEDVISAMKIKSNGKVENKSAYGNFVPILPKQDDKMDFSNSGEHFLSSRLFTPTEFCCESCQKNFGSRMQLKTHFKSFHMGKLPFKCEYCFTECLLRSEYEDCLTCHKMEKESDSLTLNDFKKDEEEDTPPGDLVCKICKRTFNSQSGLLRHKVRKHNQKNKKKYFIKGMKNAKCDICNREFSTQSYMQLHRKLHLRDDIGYKYKVFGKHRYVKSEEIQDETPGNTDEIEIVEHPLKEEDSNSSDH